MDITGLTLGGVYLTILIIGIVQFVKEQGWVTTPAKLKLLAVCVGLFFGALYEVGINFPGTVQYITIAVNILAIGIAATGLFDFTKEMASLNKPK
jgi:hypothetical protein